jgi:hypothetical protein
VPWHPQSLTRPLPAGDVYVNDWIGERECKLNKNLNKRKLRLLSNELELSI